MRIKREYRRLAKLWHPDRFLHNSPDQRRAAERMRAINDAYRLISHAPLRYGAAAGGGAPRSSGTVRARSAPLVSEKFEYTYRFVCGFLLGVVAGFAALLADMPVLVAAIIPIATGFAAMVFGDRFWYWALK